MPVLGLGAHLQSGDQHGQDREHAAGDGHDLRHAEFVGGLHATNTQGFGTAADPVIGEGAEYQKQRGGQHQPIDDPTAPRHL